MSKRHLQKHERNAIKFCKRLGFNVEFISGGKHNHLLVSYNGVTRKLALSSSPGDVRSAKNLEATLNRMRGEMS